MTAAMDVATAGEAKGSESGGRLKSGGGTQTRGEAKRQAIVDIATQMFGESGFARTSMSDICARVGGSKATLYNHFASKEELFFEVMAQVTETRFAAAHSVIDPAAEDMAAALRQFGENLLTFLYSPQLRSLRHLAIAEAGRTELGRLAYERGVLRSQSLVAEFLRSAMARGKLRDADPVVATRHLYGLLESELADRFLLQLLGDLDSEEIRAVTARAIEVFMAAYGPRSAGT